ncbi:MAG TPA: hypothetical protein VFJ43_03575, partial [Bacteroidia bacterium]|nr:hypothetical protein [Bacteroidia bacterium]
MKHLYRVLLCCSLISLSALAQNPARNDINDIKEKINPGDDTDEDKSALKEMIDDRNFPNGENNFFGRYAEEMNNYRNSSPQQLTANWNYVNASGNLNG